MKLSIKKKKNRNAKILHTDNYYGIYMYNLFQFCFTPSL